MGFAALPTNRVFEGRSGCDGETPNPPPSGLRGGAKASAMTQTGMPHRECWARPSNGRARHGGLWVFCCAEAGGGVGVGMGGTPSTYKQPQYKQPPIYLGTVGLRTYPRRPLDSNRCFLVVTGWFLVSSPRGRHTTVTPGVGLSANHRPRPPFPLFLRGRRTILFGREGAEGILIPFYSFWCRHSHPSLGSGLVLNGTQPMGFSLN